jgi:hypothetical protein
LAKKTRHRRAGSPLALPRDDDEHEEVEMSRFFAGAAKKVCLRCGRNFSIFNQSLGDLFSTCTTCRLTPSRY